ncbi:MAG: PA domain-containing protein [Actinomycetota bacterium]
MRGKILGWPRWSLIMVALLMIGVMAPAASAGPDDPVTDDPNGTEESHELQGPAGDLGAPLMSHDMSVTDIVSDGPSAKVNKNIDLRGRGERNDAGATTDVWELGGYAYTGTFNNPCGGDPEAGIWVWDVSNPNKTDFVTVIPSPTGSRANDVKAAAMNSGDILVHSNESCNGGPGGFEIYNVDDPANPIALASVQTDDVNAFLRDVFGFTDHGVHNLFLFTQDDNDYVAAVVESEFGNFQIFDITDPANPTLVGFWGAESNSMGDFPSPHPYEDYATLVDFGKILDVDAYLFSGFGASQNRFLHDITISADGTQAYLANWDAGLILLDISDVTNPTQVSVALDETSEDGEVNSHAVWPSEDGTIVVEGEEDFAPFATEFEITTGPSAGNYPAAEGAITVPIASLPGSTMSGTATYVGYACDPGNPGFDDPVPAGSGIALIQRGACTFSSKINNAEAAGYDGVVVFNDAARGDALVTMGGTATNLPGVFVGHSTGLTIMGVATAGDLVIGASGEDVSAGVEPNGWSGFRVWDYSDPSNPVLASTFNTVCSADPLDPSCDPAGTYSTHNVIVETLDDKVKAYIAWYSDGVLILDVSDPYDPVETARFLDDSTNDGEPNDFWGIYKTPDKPWIYGSDRNGGLYILKEQGAGSG